jgi:hypothetical protein
MDTWRIKVADVRITDGASDFRVYQQDQGGKAEIAVGGMWQRESERTGHAVKVRLLSEQNYSPVAPTMGWTPVDALNEDGSWRHVFRGVPAGGLYEIQTHLGWTDPAGLPAGRIGDSVHHIGVGDLWLLGGQSNSSGTGRGVADDPPELGVHILRNDERWDVASHPLNAARGTDHPNRDGGPGTSPWLTAAKVLRRELGYPIGLVQAAKGGSALREWHVGEDPSAPLWHNMMHQVRLAGGRVRGLFWHQGCSDGGQFTELDPWTYRDRWAEFVRLVRREVGDIPVVSAQINRWTDIDHVPQVRENFSVIREMQRRAGELPGVCVVPTLDIPLSDGIHNSSSGNVTLGQRMGRAALGFAYGRPLPWAAPNLRRARLQDKGRVVVLEFADVTSHLMFLGFGRDDFAVRDGEGTAGVKAAVAAGREVRLTLERPLGGEATVSGAYDIDPEWTLRDYETNMPALAFHAVAIETC